MKNDGEKMFRAKFNRKKIKTLAQSLNLELSFGMKKYFNEKIKKKKPKRKMVTREHLRFYVRLSQAYYFLFLQKFTFLFLLSFDPLWLLLWKIRSG